MQVTYSSKYYLLIHIYAYIVRKCCTVLFILLTVFVIKSIILFKFGTEKTEFPFMFYETQCFEQIFEVLYYLQFKLSLEYLLRKLNLPLD